MLPLICSGNWKRASAALRHLAEYITSGDASVKDQGAKSDLCPDIFLSKYYEGSVSSGPNLKDFHWGGSMLQNSQFQAGLKSNFSMDSYSPNGSHSSPATDLEFTGFCEQLEKLSDEGKFPGQKRYNILQLLIFFVKLVIHIRLLSMQVLMKLGEGTLIL